MAVGAVFLLAGVLGFIPGVTANFDQLHFAGHHSEALLLGHQVRRHGSVVFIIHQLVIFAGLKQPDVKVRRGP